MPSRSRFDLPARRALWVAVVLVFLALVLRLWTIACLRDAIEIHTPILDGRFYLELAQRLASGGGWPNEPHFMTPLYPWLLGGLFRVTSADVGSVQIAQMVLGAATLILLMAGLWRRFGGLPALLAGVLYTFHGPIIAMENLVLTESLLCFLVTAALALWPEQARAHGTSTQDGRIAARPAASVAQESGPSWVALVAFGLVCGLLALGRGTFLVLPIVAASLLLWRGSQGGPGRAGAPWPRLRPLLLIFLGVALPLAPMAVFQSRQAGRLQILTVNGGLNLYLGNNPWARGIYSAPPNVDLSRDIKAQYSASMASGRRLDLVETSAYWRGEALDFLRENPGRATWLWGRKMLLYLTPREIPQIEDFDALTRRAEPLRLAFLRFSWLLPLATVGAAWGVQRLGWRMAPYLAVIATGWLATVVFFATGRYRIAVLPGFLVLASFGLVFVIEAIRARRFDAWIICGALVLISAAQFALPTFDRAKAQAFHEYQIGQRELDAGRTDAALEAYRAALASDPGLGEAWHGIGAALARAGRLAESVDAYERATQVLPGSALTWYNLGSVYGRLGDDVRARDAFEHALRLDPGHLEARFSLGVALAKLGDLEAARTRWNEVLRVAPNHREARNALNALEN